MTVRTSREPVPAPQVTANATSTLPSAGTTTSRGFCPSTSQFAARPVSSTDVAPAVTLATLTVAAMPIGCASPSPIAKA